MKTIQERQGARDSFDCRIKNVFNAFPWYNFWSISHVQTIFKSGFVFTVLTETRDKNTHYFMTSKESIFLFSYDLRSESIETFWILKTIGYMVLKQLSNQSMGTLQHMCEETLQGVYSVDNETPPSKFSLFFFFFFFFFSTEWFSQWLSGWASMHQVLIPILAFRRWKQFKLLRMFCRIIRPANFIF